MQLTANFAYKKATKNKQVLARVEDETDTVYVGKEFAKDLDLKDGDQLKVTIEKVTT